MEFVLWQWYQTALLITYDEHGSYYDHVAPPGGTTIPSPDQKQASSSDKFNFDRLGVRVPTILVSPWINKNTVIHEPHPLMGHGPTSQYEHSSIAASLKRIFGLPEYLTERDAWAASFDRLLTERRTPREDCPADIFFPPEVLSAPPTLTSALPKSPRTSGVPISHEQHLILQLAASLNNDFSAQIKNLKVWNTHTAQEFIDRNVKTFFQKLRMSQSDLNNT